MLIRLDRLDGHMLEDKVAKNLPAFLGREFRKCRVLDRAAFAESLKGRLPEAELADLMRADVIAVAKRAEQVVHIVVAVSCTADADDLARAVRRAPALASAGHAAIGIVACESISPQGGIQVTPVQDRKPAHGLMVNRPAHGRFRAGSPWGRRRLERPVWFDHVNRATTQAIVVRRHAVDEHAVRIDVQDEVRLRADHVGAAFRALMIQVPEDGVWLPVVAGESHTLRLAERRECCPLDFGHEHGHATESRAELSHRVEAMHQPVAIPEIADDENLDTWHEPALVYGYFVLCGCSGRARISARARVVSFLSSI
jgi:hypothetical protein